MSSADGIFGTYDPDEVISVLARLLKIDSRAKNMSFAEMSAPQQNVVRNTLTGKRIRVFAG